jgi:hypothetical protein
VINHNDDERTNGRLGNALDVVTKDLTMALSTALAEAFATFAASRHVQGLKIGGRVLSDLVAEGGRGEMRLSELRRGLICLSG